jgi:hypothetical protein
MLRISRMDERIVYVATFVVGVLGGVTAALKWAI